MTRYLEKLILDNWENWVGGIKPKNLDFLKTHAGQATRNKKVGFFVFNNDKPIIFVKTVRESKYNEVIESGFKKLKHIYRELSDGSAPKPIYIGNHQGIIFSLETAITGKQFHSCKKQKDLERFLDWFFRFQRLMQNKKELSIGGLPSIIQHGDLTPDNVINDRGEIRVIDWDNFGKIDMPLFDLLAFLQRWSGIRDISFIHKYSDIIRKYLEEFKIDKKALKFLIFNYYLLDFKRKEKVLTDYDKKYLEARLKEVKKL